jgi:hypothetical protein
MGGGAGSGADVVAGACAEPVGCGAAAAISSEGRLKRHPTNTAVVRTPHTTAHVANTLIREEFFQKSKMLRGTNDS